MSSSFSVDAIDTYGRNVRAICRCLRPCCRLGGQLFLLLGGRPLLPMALMISCIARLLSHVAPVPPRSVVNGFTRAQRRLFERNIDSIYSLFKETVASGRGMPEWKVERLAQVRSVSNHDVATESTTSLW